MSNYDGRFMLGAINNPWNLAFDLIEPRSTVLDVGCSKGNFGAALMEFKQCVVDGVEPDIDDAKTASKKLRRVAHGFVEEALKGPIANNKYDHIVFLDVIEHLYSPVSALRKLRKHIKPNGTIIFSIPNMAHASVRIMLLGGEFEYGDTGLLDNTHLHFYTKKEIERVFKEAGYAIDVLNYTEAVYPKEVIVSELIKVGISKPSPQLVSLLSTDEAKIFQYVGSASITQEAPPKRAHYSPDPQRSIKSWYEEKEQLLQNMLREKDKQIESLREDIDKNTDELRHLLNTLHNDRALAERLSLRKHLKYYLERKTRGKKNHVK